MKHRRRPHFRNGQNNGGNGNNGNNANPGNNRGNGNVNGNVGGGNSGLPVDMTEEMEELAEAEMAAAYLSGAQGDMQMEGEDGGVAVQQRPLTPPKILNIAELKRKT